MLKLTQEEKQWAGQALSRFEQKLAAVRGRSVEKIPSYAKNGVHNNKADGAVYAADDGINWWTNGFWAGMLWRHLQSKPPAKPEVLILFLNKNVNFY